MTVILYFIWTINYVELQNGLTEAVFMCLLFYKYMNCKIWNYILGRVGDNISYICRVWLLQIKFSKKSLVSTDIWQVWFPQVGPTDMVVYLFIFLDSSAYLMTMTNKITSVDLSLLAMAWKQDRKCKNSKGCLKKCLHKEIFCLTSQAIEDNEQINQLNQHQSCTSLIGPKIVIN